MNLDEKNKTSEKDSTPDIKPIGVMEKTQNKTEKQSVKKYTYTLEAVNKIGFVSTIYVRNDYPWLPFSEMKSNEKKTVELTKDQANEINKGILLAPGKRKKLLKARTKK